MLATTNCIVLPLESYRERVFTSQVVAVPGGTRIRGNDFAPLIAKARACKPLAENHVKDSTIGFHYTTILSLAEQIVAGVKS